MHVDDARLLELVPQIVALAGTFANTGKHRKATMLARHVVDQLLDDDGLAHTSAAEQTDLAALQKGQDQINNLDAGLEHLFRRRLLVKGRRLPMNRHPHLGVDRAKLVHRLAENVEHAAQRLATHRDGDHRAGVDGLHAPNQSPRSATMAMQRTRPSPRCCCTSTTTSIGVGTSKPSLTMRNAWKMGGMCASSN